MSRPSNRVVLTVATGGRHSVSPAELVAAVRRGVESGTIKGEVVKVTDSGKRDWIDPVIRLTPNTLEYGDSYIVIGPVSDGGSET